MKTLFPILFYILSIFCSNCFAQTDLSFLDSVDIFETNLIIKNIWSSNFIIKDNYIIYNRRINEEVSKSEKSALGETESNIWTPTRPFIAIVKNDTIINRPKLYLKSDFNMDLTVDHFDLNESLHITANGFELDKWQTYILKKESDILKELNLNISGSKGVYTFLILRDSSAIAWLSFKKKKVPHDNIYKFSKNGDRWIISDSLKNINKNYRIAYPSIASDSILVYSLIKELPYGQADLYYSIKRNNTWSNPKSISSKINSKSNETFIQFSNDFLTEGYFLRTDTNCSAKLFYFNHEKFKKNIIVMSTDLLPIGDAKVKVISNGINSLTNMDGEIILKSTTPLKGNIVIFKESYKPYITDISKLTNNSNVILELKE